MAITSVKEYVERFITLDEPVPYKGLKVHQFKVKDYNNFMSSIPVLQIEKNKIPNPEIIKMGYMEYLNSLVFQNDTKTENGLTVGELYQGCFFYLIQNSLKIPPDKIVLRRNRSIHSQKMYLDCGDVTLNERDFDELRKIIFAINLYDYDEIEMSDDIKEAINEYYALKNKNIVFPNIQKKIFTIMTSTSLNMEQINEMPILTFEELFHFSKEKADYSTSCIVEALYHTALGKPMKEKDRVEHWLYKKKKDKFSEVFTPVNDFRQDIRM